jgi:hypothetical protein
MNQIIKEKAVMPGISRQMDVTAELLKLQPPTKTLLP